MQPLKMILVTAANIISIHNFIVPVLFKGRSLQPGCFFSSDSLRSQAYKKAIPSSGLATAE
jgi:hypothetical protein